MSAAEWLAKAEEQGNQEVIRDYGEERFAKQIAAAIVAARRREPLVRTRQLADLVARAVRTREPGQDPATRTFQAVRIHVNRELEEVSLMLPQALARLAPKAAPGGDQLPFARRPHREALHAGAGAPGNAPPILPLRASEMPQPSSIVGRAQRVPPRDNKKPAGAAPPPGGRARARPPIHAHRIEPGARWRN